MQYQNLTKQAFNYRKQQSGIAIGFYGHIVISMCFMLSYNAFVNGLSELGLMTCLTLAYNLLHVIAVSANFAVTEVLVLQRFQKLNAALRYVSDSRFCSLQFRVHRKKMCKF